jgi:hypothetical protein
MGEIICRRGSFGPIGTRRQAGCEAGEKEEGWQERLLNVEFANPAKIIAPRLTKTHLLQGAVERGKVERRGCNSGHRVVAQAHGGQTSVRHHPGITFETKIDHRRTGSADHDLANGVFRRGRTCEVDHDTIHFEKNASSRKSEFWLEGDRFLGIGEGANGVPGVRIAQAGVWIFRSNRLLIQDLRILSAKRLHARARLGLRVFHTACSILTQGQSLETVE